MISGPYFLDADGITIRGREHGRSPMVAQVSKHSRRSRSTAEYIVAALNEKRAREKEGEGR